MTLIFVICMAFVSVVSAALVALGPSRGVIGIASVALTGSLGLLAWIIFEMNAVFWLFPTFLIVDLSLIYLLSSSELTQSKKSEGKKPETESTIYNIFWISIVIFLTLLVGKHMWAMPLGSLTVVNEAFTDTYKILWAENWYLALFCLMVLCPAAFGCLLMMRSKK